MATPLAKALTRPAEIYGMPYVYIGFVTLFWFLWAMIFGVSRPWFFGGVVCYGVMYLLAQWEHDFFRILWKVYFGRLRGGKFGYFSKGEGNSMKGHKYFG